jgi:hypothetical protein
VTVVVALYYGLIASLPALLIFDSLTGSGLISLFAATALTLTATTLSSHDLKKLPRLLNPAIFFGLAATFLIMLLQLLPMTGGPLIHPIWASAAGALAERAAGSITIDTGMTMRAICRLSCLIAIIVLAIAISIHRARAQNLLLVLTAIATLVSIEAIKNSILPDTFQLIPSRAQIAATAMSIIGFILAGAATIRGLDHSRSTRPRSARPRTRTSVETTMASLACLINLGAVICSGDATGLFAALFGGSILLAVVAVRKGGFSPWGQAGAAAVLALALVAFIAFMPGYAESDLIARMMDDARPMGAGAGTLAALASIYGNWSSISATDIPATATTAIEMGRPFLWLALLVAAAWVMILLRGALLRGRDYVYPAAGAGCLAALLVSATSSGGVFALAPSILLSVTLGLAIAQNKSDTSSPGIVRNSRPPLQQPSDASPEPHPFKWGLYGISFIFSLVLVAQGAWIILPEVSRPKHIGFPSDQGHATVARQEQDQANRSAAIAVVRGDLWAESAFTYAGMLWTDQAFDLDAKSDRNAKAQNSLSKTLRYSPHRGDAWLMRAAVCERLQIQACNIGALLKMSYYTAPDEADLLPVRLTQVLHAKEIGGDDELADMARRDIRFVLTRSATLRPALIAAYRSASPAGKLLVEQTVTPVEPGYLPILRGQLT